MEIRMAGATDVGLVRKNNQDAFYFDAKQGIAIVADGIGGRKGGEVASRLAVEGMRDAYLGSDVLRPDEIGNFLSRAVEQVNAAILKKGMDTPEVRGMGTTLNCLLFVGDRVHIAHVGDSRTYLYDRGSLWQLTIDHNIETFVKRGWLERRDVAPGTRDAALVKSVGLVERCEVDLYDMRMREGQIFITCSDGLTGMMSDQRLLEIIAEHSSNLNKLPRVLVEEANRRGGKDNITVVVSQVRGS